MVSKAREDVEDYSATVELMSDAYRVRVTMREKKGGALQKIKKRLSHSFGRLFGRNRAASGASKGIDAPTVREQYMKCPTDCMWTWTVKSSWVSINILARNHICKLEIMRYQFQGFALAILFLITCSYVIVMPEKAIMARFCPAYLYVTVLRH
uniref:Uncharacterized protein n=1 Tax=Anopheles atroparvus TaxID=41427 RepID=A0A182IQQ6_ANOAO